MCRYCIGPPQINTYSNISSSTSTCSSVIEVILTSKYLIKMWKGVEMKEPIHLVIGSGYMHYCSLVSRLCINVLAVRTLDLLDNPLSCSKNFA